VTATALPWPTDALAAALGARRPGLRVEVWAEADSSNTRLLERARGGDAAPCLLVVEHQTAGRGRLGRSWFADAPSADAPPGPATLCLSLGLVLAPTDWSGLSLAVGVALAEALGPEVTLKWPNDLWLADGPGPGRKLGGVLIETLPLADGGRYAVIGVGLNLAAPAPRPGLEQPVAGWREIDPQATADALLARIAAPLLDAVLAFERGGFAAFAARYAARDGLAGRAVQAQGLSGIAEGVDRDGALRLRTAEGTVAVRSGEVSVRPC
jgi:BirA family biotin operon repressor/biotin-[acetyl-CoA-carboxylase] ligase